MFLRFLLGNIMKLIITNCNFFCIILLLAFRNLYKQPNLLAYV